MGFPAPRTKWATANHPVYDRRAAERAFSEAQLDGGARPARLVVEVAEIELHERDTPNALGFRLAQVTRFRGAVACRGDASQKFVEGL